MTPGEFYELGKAYGRIKIAPEPEPPNTFGDWVRGINAARIALLTAAEEIASADVPDRG